MVGAEAQLRLKDGHYQDLIAKQRLEADAAIRLAEDKSAPCACQLTAPRDRSEQRSASYRQ